MDDTIDNKENSLDWQNSHQQFSDYSYGAFQIQIAKMYGVHEALLIGHIKHLIMCNKKENKNNFEGKTWMSQKISDIADNFPYLKKNKVERTINKLVRNEVLIKKNFNESHFNRTCWYAFKDEEMFSI